MNQRICEPARQEVSYLDMGRRAAYDLKQSLNLGCRGGGPNKWKEESVVMFIKESGTGRTC